MLANLVRLDNCEYLAEPRTRGRTRPSASPPQSGEWKDLTAPAADGVVSTFESVELTESVSSYDRAMGILTTCHHRVVQSCNGGN